MTPSARPRVMIVGGADVTARLPLMERLRDEFELIAVGCGAEPAAAFAERGFAYRAYAPLHARVSPLDDARGFLELARSPGLKTIGATEVAGLGEDEAQFPEAQILCPRRIFPAARPGRIA